MYKNRILVLGLCAMLFMFCAVGVSAAIDWDNFKVFSGSSPPYAANGPGCSFGSFNFGGGGGYSGANCPDSNPVYDLGAVWVDMDNEYIAWQIYAPNMTDAEFCGGNQNGSLGGFAVAIEFDSDDNVLTGCTTNCYTGAEYQIWVFGDATTEFKEYNGTDFATATGEKYNITFNYTCSTMPTILRIAINRTAITTLTGMNFMTNSFVYGQPPSDTLGGFGDDKFEMGGPQDMMFMDDHPCFSYDGTNSTACTTNSQSITGADECVWSDFESLCDPDPSSMSCSEFCGACTNTTGCSSGAKGKCMVVTAPPASMLPPNAVTWDTGTKMCVEDMSKFIFGGVGSCDDDCKYCYGESTCNNSAYPDPMGSGSGCQWVTDSTFGDSWCDLSTFSLATFDCSSTNLERCFTQASCEGFNGNWSSDYQVCYTHDDAIEFLCFDGIDNDGYGDIDCADSDCSKDPFCGGDIDVLGGGFGTLDPFEAMKKEMFGNMDPSPPVEIGNDPLDDPITNKLFDIISFDIKDMGKALGMGVHVEELAANSFLCDGAQPSKFYYFVDNDANSSTGCTVNISNTDYSGFEYKFEYEIKNNGTGGALEIRKGYRCINETTNTFGLFPAKLMGAPKMDFLGGESISCMDGVAILAVDKKDIGNPNGNIRFMAATSDNVTYAGNANDTILGPSDGGMYYTPGSIDFKPKDCFSNPMACGTAFSIIGGGKFMPFEDCFLGSGDEDLDGLTNCADPDCQMAPWCAGQYNFSTDKTAPTVVSNKVETFIDFVFMHWITNEPTNSTITFHSSCTNSTAVNTFYELGDPFFTFDDYKPWHGLDIEDGDTDSLDQSVSLQQGQPYYYKLKNCDQAGNCGTSACLNFTTKGASDDKSFQYKFDFTPPADSLVNTTELKLWNGTNYVNITQNKTNTQANFLKNASLLFNNTENGWSIELEGVDLTKTLSLNLSNTFNITVENGTNYIGMKNQDWSNMAQNLGVDYITIKIPQGGDRLIKCNENNLSDCSDVTSQATMMAGGYGYNYTIWKVPTSLGFSTYASSSNISLQLDKEAYKCWPTCIAYVNITNSNISLTGSHNLTINNTAAATGINFSIYLRNGTGTEDWYLNETDNVKLVDYNFSLGVHEVKLNISVPNASISTQWNFSLTVDDLTPLVVDAMLDDVIPIITNISTSGTSSSTSSGTATITATTNENANCWYKTSAFNATDITGATAMSGSSTSHTFTKPYTSSTTIGPYYISCRDTAGNNMATSNSTGDISVTVTTTTGGGGGGASAVTYEEKTVGTLAAGSTKAVAFTKSATLAVTEITVTVKNAVTNAKIKVDAGSLPSGASVPSSAKGSVYKYITITKTAMTDSDVTKGIIKFKVKRSWLTEKGYGKDTISLHRYYSNKWNKLTTTRDSQDTTYYYYSSESPGFSTFAITAEKAPAVITPPAEEEPEEEAEVTEEEAPAEEGAPAEEEEVPPEKAPLNITLIATLIAVIIILAIVGYFIQQKKKKY